MHRAILVFVVILTGCVSSKNSAWDNPFTKSGFNLFHGAQKTGVGTILKLNGDLQSPASEYFLVSDFKIVEKILYLGHIKLCSYSLDRGSFIEWVKSNPERASNLPLGVLFVIEALKFYPSAPFIAYKAVRIESLLSCE